MDGLWRIGGGRGGLSAAKGVTASAQFVPAVSGSSEIGQVSNTQCGERRRQYCGNTQRHSRARGHQCLVSSAKLQQHTKGFGCAFVREAEGRARFLFYFFCGFHVGM